MLAKVPRDAIMAGLGDEHPAYGWVENKGYAAPEHLDALRRLGPCELHRRSWRLPGTMDDDDEPTDPVPVSAHDLDLSRVGAR